MGIFSSRGQETPLYNLNDFMLVTSLSGIFSSQFYTRGCELSIGYGIH